MSKPTRGSREKHLKTETFPECDSLPLELPRPTVRLPLISKKSGSLRFRYVNTIDRSLDEEASLRKPPPPKEDRSLHANDALLRKYSNNSQLQLLSFEELQLCADHSRKILPKIAQFGFPSRQNTERSVHDDVHKRLSRIKSEKKIESNGGELCSYKLGAVLGRGSYSVVKLCETGEGRRFAAKVYPKQKINSPQRELNLREEISILKAVSHHSIIGFREHIETHENHYVIL
jgi:hypothetical protein